MDMELFGSAFDDSMFLEERERVCETLSSYSVKRCEPQWFCDAAALDTDDSLEKQKVYKFRGDLAVTQHNYQKALEAYSCCLEWIPDNNIAIRRDVLEGMTRCCSRLGQRDRALDLLQSLSKETSNTCHLTSLLLLKVSIYQRFGAVRSQMSSLQQLCSLLPFNPWYWFNLGHMCLQLLEKKSTSTADEKSDGESKEHQEEEETSELDEDRLRLKACTCFIRTRLLLRILQQQQSSFVLQRSKNTLQTINEALERLNPEETTLQTVIEVMSEDLTSEKMKDDYQDGESLSSVCVQSFRERWWNKILLKTDGAQTKTDTTSSS